MPTHPHARLYFPSPEMEGLILVAAERDTREVQLNNEQRYNFYPASPLPLIAWIFEGDLRIVDGSPDDEDLRLSTSSPRLGLIGPFRKPAASWAPGAVHAIWVSVSPDALWRLWGIRAEDYMDMIVPLEELVSSAVFDALAQIGASDKPLFQQIESVLQSMWQGSQVVDTSSADLRGWIASLSQQVACTNASVGMRQMQRRIKACAGQSMRKLQIFARVEEVFAQLRNECSETKSLTMIASDAGYSDQSHMGREIRRVTGLPPKRFFERMQTDEAFWIYRLINEYLQNRGVNLIE